MCDAVEVTPAASFMPDYFFSPHKSNKDLLQSAISAKQWRRTGRPVWTGTWDSARARAHTHTLTTPSASRGVLCFGKWVRVWLSFVQVKRVGQFCWQFRLGYVSVSVRVGASVRPLRPKRQKPRGSVGVRRSSCRTASCSSRCRGDVRGCRQSDESPG